MCARVLEDTISQLHSWFFTYYFFGICSVPCLFSYTLTINLSLLWCTALRGMSDSVIRIRGMMSMINRFTILCLT